MDTFDVNTLEVYIKKYKSNIVNKLDTLILSDKTITNQCDDVCMVLEYSPKINRRSNYFPKYPIVSERRHSEKRMPMRNQALNLETRPDNNDAEGEDEDEEEEDEEDEGEGEEDEDEKDESVDKDLGRMHNDNHKYHNQSQSQKNTINNSFDANGNGNNVNSNSNLHTNSQIEGRHLIDDSNQGNQSKDQLAYDMLNDRYTVMCSNNSLKQNRLLLEGKIRVYVLNSEKFLEFEINGDEETFKQLKKKVLDKLESAANFSLEHHNLDSYELRVVNEYNIVQFNEPPIDESESIITKGQDAIAFLQKQQYIGFGRLSTQPKPIKLIGNVISSSEVDKINLKIFIKLDVNNPSSTILQIPTESTLKNVIESLADKSRIPYKNSDLYYFVEHSIKNTVSEDGEDAINVDMQLKSLNTFEVDLFYRKFLDQPNWLNFSMTQKVFISGGKKHKISDDMGREYQFNSKTAIQYQEFEVLKIKKTRARQERMLGIDQYYLYNEMPKKKNNQTNIIALLHAKIKHPLKKISNVKDCGMISNKAFFIDIIRERNGNNGNVNVNVNAIADENADEEIKKIVYEVKSTNLRNEIVNKLKFLIKINKEKLDSNN